MTIYFYSNSIDYFEFSNFYTRELFIQGKYWQSVEHYYQAMKTLAPNERRVIVLCDTAYEAKVVGRGITIRPEWDIIKEKVMKKALLCKFTQHDDLMKKLLETGAENLVEDGNDEYWGRGKNGKGKNKLGILLMEVRDILRGIDNY